MVTWAGHLPLLLLSSTFRDSEWTYLDNGVLMKTPSRLLIPFIVSLAFLIALPTAMAANRPAVSDEARTERYFESGVRGPQHPLSEYMRAGVPVALATDDEGVSRSDMTHEYLRGAQEQNLSYVQLKKMARTSLEHAFIGGPSLWRDGRAFVVVKECGSENVAAKQPSAACQKFLGGSEKARLQWNLESELGQFEANAWTSSKTSSSATRR